MKKSLLVLFLFGLLVAVAPVWSGGEQEVEPEEPVMEEPEMEEPVMEPKYKEAPMLAALVARGELPPVEERLPLNPKVVTMIEGIGKYGGELRVMATGENIFNQDLQGMWGHSVFRPPQNQQWIEPDLAEGWEIADDNKSITIFLREGAKWSDGAPITSEDIRFTYEDMHFNPDVRTWGAIAGAITSVTVIDDYAIALNASGGLMTVPYSLADWFGGYATTVHPAHYLKKWHGDYNPDAEKLAQEEGFDHWYGNGGAMMSHYWWAPLKDPDKPQFEPWQLDAFSPTAKSFSRNPYFYRVDPEGNQLPYIDRLVVQIVDPEVKQLKVTGGEASISYYNLPFSNLSLYKTNEETGDYETRLYPGMMPSDVKINLHGEWHKDPEIRTLFRQISFKRGLSVAINRDEINDLFYEGLGVPGKVAPLSSVSFYKKGWREDWAQYDPALANKLLDEVGLEKRDSDGWRLLPSGKLFNFIIDYNTPGHTPQLEVVKEYFEDVGVRTILKLGEGGLIEELRVSQATMAGTHPNPMHPWAYERNLYVNTWVWGGPREYNIWEDDHRDALVAQLEEGEVLPQDWHLQPSGVEHTYSGGGEVPPEDWKYHMSLEDRFQNTKMGSPEYMEIGRELFEWYTEVFFAQIGLVGEVPQILIVKNGLKNVVNPDFFPGAPLGDHLVQTWMDQLYWE
jgi:peptide/nickel transport system substrate-binding protein